MSRIDLGRYGFSVDVREDGSHIRSALTIEGLGFGTLWVNGGQLDTLDGLTDLLAGTNTVKVGSAIIPPDRYNAAEVCALYQRAELRAPGRLVVGLGTPHRPKALTLVGAYLDELACVPDSRMLLAAHGPRALALARDRCGGATSMLFTEQQTTRARRILGTDRALAVGLYVVLDDDPTRARAIARQPLRFLTTMPAYRRSLERQGFSSTDIAGLSDHLVDTLVAWGSPGRVLDCAERLHAAGADHVRFTALGPGGGRTDLDTARLLAAQLG